MRLYASWKHCDWWSRSRIEAQGFAKSANERWPRLMPSGPFWNRQRPRLAAPVLKNNVEGLRLCLDELKAAAAAGDYGGYALHNINFHRQIMEAANNRILLKTWDSLGFETRVRIELARTCARPRASSSHPRPDHRSPRQRRWSDRRPVAPRTCRIIHASRPCPHWRELTYLGVRELAPAFESGSKLPHSRDSAPCIIHCSAASRAFFWLSWGKTQ